MNQYEVMYVIDATLEDSARNELINRFSDLVKKNGGETDRVDEWGKRRLAYAINYKTEGYYVLMYVKAPADLPKELERNFQISDKVLRSPKGGFFVGLSQNFTIHPLQKRGKWV